MATIKVTIPDDVANAFNKAFEGEDKDAVMARLLRTAVEERERSRRRPGDFVERSRRIRASGQPVSDEEIRRARQEFRRSFDDLVAEVLRLREEQPFFSDDDIRKARKELRE